MDEINILKCELIGSEPGAVKNELDEAEGMLVGFHVLELVCDHGFLFISISVASVKCAPMLNASLCLHLPKTQQNNISIIKTLT